MVRVSRGWGWSCPPGWPGSAGSTPTSLPEGLRASDLGVQRLSGSRVAKGPAEPGNPGQPLGLPQPHLSVPASIGNLLSWLVKYMCWSDQKNGHILPTGQCYAPSNQTKPNQTKPNQTKLNQTKLNQTKPNQMAILLKIATFYKIYYLHYYQWGLSPAQL